mmetsp:Transcript_98362/g.317143  ORF Transcript_98362/g.317143 Transcript_98362/m.317143 type:complete len:531 (-) Transcript_98362:84-1676(-)
MGGWAPVQCELSLKGLRIRGRIPEHLHGSIYLRNGPNPALEPYSLSMYHAFDGHGMIHSISFPSKDSSSSGAGYDRRYVRTRGLSRELEVGQSLFTGMRDMLPKFPLFFEHLWDKFAGCQGTPDTPYWVIMSRNPSNNGCTVHAGKLLSTWEAGSAYELSLPSLETRGLCTFNGSLDGGDFWQDNASAHGKVDPVTGELVTISYNMLECWVKVVIVGKDGAVVRRRKVSLKQPTLCHDFAITATRVVLNDGPLCLRIPKVMFGAKPFDFDYSTPCRFGILNRDGSGDVVWIETEPCMNFHVVNAYDDPEDPDRVVVYTFRQDASLGLGFADAQHAEERSCPHGRPLQSDTAALHRWALDVRRGVVLESRRLRLEDGGEPPLCDFGCVDSRRVGLPSTLAWSCAYEASIQEGRSVGEDEVPPFTRLLRHDLRSGAVTSYDLRDREPGGSAGASSGGSVREGRFICNDICFAPGVSDAEGCGSLLALVHDVEEGVAELRVVNAESMELECAVEIPTRVPYGFHCGFAPGVVA